MICPSCQETISAPVNRCPFCGIRILRMSSGVVKTSSVLIVSDEVQAIYPSVRDVPEPLRRQLVASTTGRNSGTIVIADRRGKEEIEKAAKVERMPQARALPPCTQPRWRQFWPAIVTLVVGAAGVWLAFLVRW